MSNAIMALGRAVCHQFTERSFIIGEQLPVCARCSGIFLGALVSHLFFVVFPGKAKSLPRLSVTLALVGLMLPMVIDGASSYLGWRETTNFIRLFTGLGMGLALPLFYVPLMQEDPRPGPGSIGFSHLGIILVDVGILGVLLWLGWPPVWLVWAGLIALGHALVYISIFRLVLARLGLYKIYWSLGGYLAFVILINLARAWVGL